MKKTKMHKGITLIALIITIVVLLILAVITINAIKDGGIITYAQNAASDHTIAGEKEQIALGYSEYMIEKNISEDATLKVEGATVTGSKENGWKVTFNKTNNAYEVDKDGNITYVEAEEDDTDVIATEKYLKQVSYFYNTMYNLNQPEIVPAAGFYDDDQDNNKICDYNQSLGAYIYNADFNIPIDFFEGINLTPGDIAATITYLDGEEKNITLKTTDNKVWKYNEEGTTGLVEPTDIEIECRPYTKAYGYDVVYKDDQETHALSIKGEMCVPIQKLSILGKSIEFPFNCQAMLVGGDFDTQEQIPMYTNINNVSKITVNFSNGTNKVCTKDDIFEASLYKGSYCYSSQDVPILYADGEIVVNMPDSSLKMQIQSIIIEEEGVSTKFNIVEGITNVEHTSPGS